MMALEDKPSEVFVELAKGETFKSVCRACNGRFCYQLNRQTVCRSFYTDQVLEQTLKRDSKTEPISWESKDSCVTRQPLIHITKNLIRWLARRETRWLEKKVMSVPSRVP